MGMAEAASVLHEHGALLDLQDYVGWTALMWASFMGHRVLATFLISCGAALDVKNLDGPFTPAPRLRPHLRQLWKQLVAFCLQPLSKGDKPHGILCHPAVALSSRHVHAV